MMVEGVITRECDGCTHEEKEGTECPCCDCDRICEHYDYYEEVSK